LLSGLMTEKQLIPAGLRCVKLKELKVTAQTESHTPGTKWRRIAWVCHQLTEGKGSGCASMRSDKAASGTPSVHQ